MKRFTLYTFLLLLLFNYSMAQPEVKDEEKIKLEKVYPNPVETYVNIEISQENYTFAEIELIDILGNKVQKWQPKALFPGTQKLRVDFQNLRTGIYLLKITVDEHVFVKRIHRE